MLAATRWFDSHSAPNAVAVVMALNTTARIKLSDMPMDKNRLGTRCDS